MTKTELRQSMRAMLARLSPDEFVARSAAATRRLMAEPEFQSAATILVYLPLPRELCTVAIAEAAWASGKRVAAPRMDWQTCAITPIEINSLEEDCRPGLKGIREPLGEREIRMDAVDLVITPGLAFDVQGGRLGRGAGFYDRLFSRADFRGCACGFALEEQVLPAVPCDSHDIAMRLIVTDQQVRRFAAGGSAR